MLKKPFNHYSFSSTLAMEECCKNHFSEYYQGAKFDCNVTQLTTGKLETNTICAPVKDVHLEVFSSNQALLYEEEANINSIAFCWIKKRDQESRTSNTIISGHKMNNSSIAGFNRLSKTGGNAWNILGADDTLYCMSLRWERLKERIQSLHAYNAYARIEECIGIDCENSASSLLKQLVINHFNGRSIKQPGKAFDLAIASLEDDSCTPATLTSRCNSTDLIEDLVKLIHQDRNGMPPISLSEISEYLDLNKTSLNRACKSMFDMTVLELVKAIRLEQVRKALSCTHLSSGLRLHTKARTAQYYGFTKWVTFEELYFRSFLETPEETIDRTREINVGFSSQYGGIL